MAIQLIKNQFFNLYNDKYPFEKLVVLIAPSNKSHMNLPDEGYIENWEPIIFTKKKEDKVLTDYPTTNICDRLCSPKLRKIIEENLEEDDNEIQWLPMHIKDEETEEFTEYYYLHFPEYCDVLDLERSKFNKTLGVVDLAFFMINKIKNKSIFNCKGDNKATFISRKLKEHLFKTGCTGISVTPLTVIDEISEDKKAS